MVGMRQYASVTKKRKASSQKRRKVVPIATRDVGVHTDTFSAAAPRSYPIGKTRKVNFIYHEVFAMNPGAGVPATYVFSANGCYDPNISGVGHQPRGFDELMQLFEHGTVIGTKIDVGMYNNNAEAMTYVLSLRDITTVPSTFDDALEVPGCQWTVAPTQNGGGVSNLSLSVNPNKFLGRSKPLTEDNLRFSRTGNPATQCYFHIVAGTPTLSDPGTVHIHVRIQYTCILTEPTMPLVS